MQAETGEEVEVMARAEAEAESDEEFEGHVVGECCIFFVSITVVDRYMGGAWCRDCACGGGGRWWQYVCFEDCVWCSECSVRRGGTRRSEVLRMRRRSRRLWGGRK